MEAALCGSIGTWQSGEPGLRLWDVKSGAWLPSLNGAGIADGCRYAGCALLGGETAEHPGVLRPDEYDVSATGVGVVE